jgi:uncharacterized membrane protein YjjP (DUF1212 family)
MPCAFRPFFQASRADHPPRSRRTSTHACVETHGVPVEASCKVVALLTPSEPQISEVPSSTSVGYEPRIDFVLTLGRALHGQGASASRLESALTEVAKTLGLEARFFSTPTAIMAAFGPLYSERTCLARVEPGSLDLEKLADLHDVSREVVGRTLAPREARLRVTEIVARKPRYGFLPTVLAYGVSSAAGAVFFNGEPVEVLLSLFIGTGVGITGHLLGRNVDASGLVEPAGAAFAAFAAAFAAMFVPGLSPILLTLAGVITLLPGLGLTTAMTELATRHLASGTARFAGAFVQLVGLGFGTALGSRVGHMLPRASGPPFHATSPAVATVVAVVIASLAFGVLLRVRPKDTGWVVLASGIAFAGARAGSALLGPELGAFVGAAAVTLSSNLYARVLDRPSSIPQVAGILMLVPGSIGLRSVFSLLENDIVSGVNAAFRMILVATSLVAGLLFANVAFPSRRAL